MGSGSSKECLTECPKCGADLTGEVNNKNQTVEGNGNGQVNTKTVKKNENGNGNGNGNGQVNNKTLTKTVKKNENRNVQVNKSQIKTDLVEDCEHRAFHMEAINKNGARIRISPEILF